MSIIKLAGSTGKALKGLFQAIKGDVKGNVSNIKNKVIGARMGFKFGDVGKALDSQLTKNKKMGSRLGNFKDKVKADAAKDSAANLKNQKEQAESAAKKYSNLKSKAQKIIQKHKTQKKHMAIGGASAVALAAGAGYKAGQKKG